MSTFSAPLDELEQQAPPKASSAPLDDLDAAPAPSLTKSQANTELTRDPLGPGSPGYKAPPAPRPSSRFSDVWYPNGVSTEAQAGAARAASPQAAASKAAGMPLADVAGKPHDPQEDVPTEIEPKSGLPYKPSLVPALDAPGFVPGANLERNVESAATEMSRFRENDKPVYGVDPNNRFGPPVRIIPKEEEEKQRRQRLDAAAGIVDSSMNVAGPITAPMIVAGGPIAALKAGVGITAGYGASQGGGALVHGKVSPEAEHAIRTSLFFLPSLAGTVAGLETPIGKTPEGGYAAGAKVFGGKAGVAVRSTPEAFEGAVKVGGGRLGVRIPRPAPIPEPSEAAKALASFEQHTGNPDFQPAPPPVPPGTNGPEHLTPDVVKGVSDAIMQAPAAKRPNLMTEAHGNMVKWMMGRGTFTGPDGKIHTVDAEGPAKKLASKFINDEVDRRDAAAEAASKAAEATTKTTEATSKPVKPAIQPQVTAPTTTAPIAGKPPAAGNMTTDTAAVAKVVTEANIHPEQQPAIAVKKEPPKETAALAQPPKPVKPEDVAAIGKEDKASERTILQPSDDVMQNERLAAHAAPELATKLSHIAAGVPGARFDRLRPQKELERVDEKVDDAGKPPETVPDYLAAQIAADTPQAKDQLIAALHKNFNVIGIEDHFDKGNPKLASYPSVNIQVAMSNGLTAEIQVVPREVQETANQSHIYYTAGREAELRGDNAERDKQFKKAAEMHEEALARFHRRNAANPAGSLTRESSVQIKPTSLRNSKVMMGDVAGAVGESKILGPVVGSDLVNVVDDLNGKQRATENALHDQTVQEHALPVNAEGNVPAVHKSDTSSVGHASARAVQSSTFRDLARNGGESSATENAGPLNPGSSENGASDTQTRGTISRTGAGAEPPRAGLLNSLNGENGAASLTGEHNANTSIPHSAPLDELEAQPERRINTAERKRVEHLSPEERAHELLTSELTGLPNKRAFAEDAAMLAESHPHVGYADIDDFKAFNTELGHEGVDEKVLPVVGEIFRNAAAKEPGGSVKVYHRSGDEFLFRAKDEAAIGRVVDRVNKELEDAVFTAESPDGKLHTKQGAGVSHGTGRDAKAAERAAGLDKQRRKQAGLRSGDRDVPEPVGQESAQREQAEVSQAAHSAPLEEIEPSATPDVRKSAAQRLRERMRARESISAPIQEAPAPGQAGMMPVSGLTFDPKRFQYKLNTDSGGTTNLLKGQRFNEDLAGVVQVWRDPADGKVYVVNGHHRAQLAKETGQQSLLVRHLDVPDAASARAVGAMTNIAEGCGTAVDAAKFMREKAITPADLEKHGISMGEATAESGLALSKLDSYLFDKVVTGELSQGRGIAIGKATENPATQEAVFKLIEKAEKRGRRVTDGMVAELARFASRAKETTTAETSLFGNSYRTENNALDKAEVSDYIRSQIKSERRLFGSVATEEKAAGLAKSGNVIKPEENQKIARAATQAGELYDKLSASRGPIDDILENSAQRISRRENPSAVKADAYQKVRAELGKVIASTEGSGVEGSEGAPGPGKGSEEKPAFSLERPAQTFFSKAEKVAAEKLPKLVSVPSLIPTLKNAGVKDEEIKWLGLDDWFSGRKLVSKQDVLDHIRQNNVQVKEVMKGELRPAPEFRLENGEFGQDEHQYFVTIGNRKYAVGKGTVASEAEAKEYLQNHLAAKARQMASEQEKASATKFSQHTLPGGENYRELLLTLPDANPAKVARIAEINRQIKVIKNSPDYNNALYPKSDDIDRRLGSLEQERQTLVGGKFTSSHFDEPNVLAHVRFNDRIAPDGKKTLFIEEVQSDWHQKGRKQGYATPESDAKLDAAKKQLGNAWGELHPLLTSNDNLGYDSLGEAKSDIATGALKAEHLDPNDRAQFSGPMQRYYETYQNYRNAEHNKTGVVPDAPFKSTWHELAMKRMLRYAAENGYDQLGWTTGEQQAARYDLSKHVSKVSWQPNEKILSAQDVNSGEWKQLAKDVDEQKLADYIGKEPAAKIIQSSAKDQFASDNSGLLVHSISGDGLKVGGQGMKGFYDKILPDFMNKYGKKWGAKVGETQVQTSGLDKPADDGAGGLVRGGQSGYKTEPVHSIDITPSMRDSVLYEGQPLFNLSKDELRDWAAAAGRRLKVEEMGDQGSIFGGDEKMYRLSTSKQNSVAVTQSQLDSLAEQFPRIGRMLGMEQPKREGVWVEYNPPEPENLFAAAKPPELVISKAARHLMAWTSDFPRNFRGANLSAQNVDNIVGKLEKEGSADAMRLADALKQAADDAGNSGVTVLVEGSPEHVASEESFHAAQRGLGEGQIRDHLSDEAVDRLLDHPAAKAMEASLKAMGYDDNLHPTFKIAEIAAKIATGQAQDTSEAADWFVKYVDELHQQHGEANVASAFSNLYDGARELYERAKAAKTEAVGRTASGSEAGIQSPAESLPGRATGPPQEGRGIGTQENRSGKADQGQLDQPPLFSLIPKKTVAALYKQDIEPALKGASGGLKEVVTKGLRVIAPRVGVPSHLLDTIMRMKGQREEEMFRFQRTTEGMKKMFDKLPEEARVAFVDRMMHGQRQPSTELEDVADSVRAIQDRFRDMEKVFNPNLTDKENYFHLKWTKLPQGVDEDGNLIEGTGGERPNTGQGNRPLQGGRSFMKRKTLPDASAGIGRGGELLTTNPIGLLEHRVMESLKFTTARKMWEELKDTPYTVSDRGRPMHMVQFFREGQGQQAKALGYEKLNDRIAKVLFPAGSGEGMIHPGEYWVEKNAARLLNNFLSRDLIRESAAGRGIVGLKNATTAWRLAFSPFHALTESIITTGSEIGRGIEHSFNQGVRGASPVEMARGVGIAAQAPVAPFRVAREGGSAIRYVSNPQEFLATTRGQNFIKRYPEAAELIADLFTGGAKLAMHEDYRMQMVESMRRAIADNNYIGAVLRTPGALAQAIQYPLFEVYIPRLKLGMFLREYSEALADRQAEIDVGKLTRAKLARETWDNIDYRFGEVNWDNFFFNRTFKTSLQLAFRAFAWRFGNFAFTGSGVTGQARQVAESLKFLKDAATGGESARPGTNAIPKIDPRMAKLLGLAIFGLIAHGLLQYAFTREKPKDLKDLIAPRDGMMDSHGHPNRWTLPIVPYRDLESAHANPGSYLRGGTADIWTAIPEAINNRDFRNHLVSHSDDPYWEQMFDKAAHVVGVPIGFDKYRQEKKRGEGTGNALLGELGLSRATNYELSPAEKKMREIQIAHYGPGTDEDLEAREKKDDRIAAGRLTPKEMQDKIRNSTRNNFERGMRSFTYDQAKQVYDVASPEEKAMIGLMLLRKRFNSRGAAGVQ